MRAVAVYPNDKTINVIDDHPAPSLEQDDEVLLDMLEVGVCGTDKEIARFDYGLPPEGSPYLVLGHESLARVKRVGSGASRVKAGDLVVTMVRRPCPHPECRACRAGRQDFCFTGDFSERGIKGRHGFMTEQVVDRECYMHVVPGHLREVGILVEPLTIAEKALIQVWDVQERLPWTAAGIHGDGHGSRAVVLGAGPVGLLGALACIVRGFETWVYSRDLPESRAGAWTASVGAHYVSAQQSTLADLAKQVGNIDLVYEATGASQLSFETLQVLGTNGVFCFTGVPGRKAPISIDADLLMRNMVLKNQLVFGTVNAGADAFAAAIGDLAKFHVRWPEQLASLVTGRFLPGSVTDLLSGKISGIKNVVVFG
ncbi:MAG TPA: glucose 1-dehydrogenase [Kofleriaceae bacterium]|nr:glucose 1-dehydrogenase [Kofleriaceae bacterium]